jgi:ribosome biogenesis GTPase
VNRIDLASLGWDDDFAASYHTSTRGLADDESCPARITRVDRGVCDALSERGPLRVSLSGTVLAASAEDPSTTPCVGDWVVVREWPDGRLTLESVLPRRSAFVRAAVAPGSSQSQVLASNVDLAVVVEGLLPEPDLGRIERLLALAWESGARPVVILTKRDLVVDADAIREEVAAAAPGVDVFTVSATTRDGLAAFAGVVTRGITLALLGPSGAGKSTLTNALAGVEVMATRALRSDGKGRHTTAHRELIQLPGGGLVIDTPGLRSVGLTDVSESLDLVFGDIEALAADCRFADCGHNGEPGCAVLAAVEEGALPERRLDSWRKLQREARWMAMRQDARLRAVERARWKSIHKELRRSGTVRP